MTSQGTLHNFGSILFPAQRLGRLGPREIGLFGGALVVGVFVAGCSTSTERADAADDYDARPGFVEDPPGDPLPTPSGVLRLRLANMIVASPNLTICVSTIPGTGVAETTGHMIGTVDPSRGLDGTLPYPGISPYIPFPAYAAEGYAIVVRLYDRADVPFAALAAPCPPVGAVEPMVVGTVPATTSASSTLVAMGVVPASGIDCGVRDCPTPSTFLFADDPTQTPGAARVRVIQTVPNLPAPIHICFDPDYVDASNPGAAPATRVLPLASDVNGIAYGESTPFIDVPPLSGTPGAFFVHVTVAGPPDCAALTLALGPITLPFPVPADSPPDVARTVDAGDVLSLFAFGRTGGSCTDDSMCAATGGTCNTARRLCEDVLSPNVLPWQDVIGM